MVSIFHPIKKYLHIPLKDFTPLNHFLLQRYGILYTSFIPYYHLLYIFIPFSLKRISLSYCPSLVCTWWPSLPLPHTPPPPVPCAGRTRPPPLIAMRWMWLDTVVHCTGSTCVTTTCHLWWVPHTPHMCLTNRDNIQEGLQPRYLRVVSLMSLVQLWQFFPLHLEV